MMAGVSAESTWFVLNVCFDCRLECNTTVAQLLAFPQVYYCIF